MNANDYLIILSPATKGSLFTAKGVVSFLMDGMRRKADVLVIGCDSNEEIERILDLMLQEEDQPEANKKYIQKLKQSWNGWKHSAELLSKNFLDYLAVKTKRKVIYPEDVILLQNPIRDAIFEDNQKLIRDNFFKDSHLIVCYPNKQYLFPLVDKLDIQHFGRHNHVVLVNSNNPSDFIPFLKDAKRSLGKLEDTYTNRKRIQYVDNVLRMLEDKDKLYHQDPNWKLLHQIKKTLRLKNLRMSQYVFVAS